MALSQKYKRLVIDVAEDGFLIRPKSATSATVFVSDTHCIEKLAKKLQEILDLPDKGEAYDANTGCRLRDDGTIAD